MSIKKYNAFLHIVECGSITTAAKKLGPTQSRLTQLLHALEKDFNTVPNVIISGEEAQRIAWFSKSQPIDTVYVPKILNISATKLREAILENNFEYWKQYTNDKIWDQFIKMRKIILEIRRNKK